MQHTEGCQINLTLSSDYLMDMSNFGRQSNSFTSDGLTTPFQSSIKLNQEYGTQTEKKIHFENGENKQTKQEEVKQYDENLQQIQNGIKKRSNSLIITRPIKGKHAIRKQNRKHRIRDTRSIFIKNTKIYEKVEIVPKEKTPQDIYFIENILEQHFLFSRIQDTFNLDKIAKKFFHCKSNGGIIFEDQDPPTLFFIVESGELEKIFLGKVRETIKAEDTFGDFDILRESPRTATIRATGECYFWAIDSKTYKEFIDQIITEEIKENKKFIEGHHFFDIMTSEQKDEILNVTYTKMFRIGQYIGLPEDIATSYYIIKEGNVLVFDDKNVQVKLLGPGDEIGFEEFKKGKHYKYKYQAKNSRVMCIKVDKQSIERYIGEEFTNLYFKNIQRHACENNPYLGLLESTHIERIIVMSKFQIYKHGTVLIREGKIAQKIYFILEGQAKLEKASKRSSLNKTENETLSNKDQCEYFEQGSVIFDIKKPTPGNFTIVKDSTIAELDAMQFLEEFGDLSILGEAIRVPQNPYIDAVNELSSFYDHETFQLYKDAIISNYKQKGRRKSRRESIKSIRKNHSCDNLFLLQDSKNHNISLSHIHNGISINGQSSNNLNHSMLSNGNGYMSSEVKLQQQINQIDIQTFLVEDFIHIKQIGKGYFGTTHLCHNIKDKQNYAIKAIQKHDIVEKHMENQVLEEKHIMEQLSHPFIMNYYGSFMDNYNIYFVLQCIEGVELFDAIRVKGLYNPEELLYYTTSLIHILEYMHTQQIVYRDLKPENIMINNQGQIKLIDLGASIRLNLRGGRTFTMTGTPHYMAPEITDGKGYSYYVDLWSLGIVLYECLCGPTPFGTVDLEDPVEIYEAIKNNQLEFPDFVTNEDIKSFIGQLLHKKPFKRVGGSWATLKQHPYFDIRGKFDWAQLQEFYDFIPPPFIPEEPNVDQDEIDAAIKKNIPLSSQIEQIEYDNEKCKYNKLWEEQFLITLDELKEDDNNNQTEQQNCHQQDQQ